MELDWRPFYHTFIAIQTDVCARQLRRVWVVMQDDVRGDVKVRKIFFAQADTRLAQSILEYLTAVEARYPDIGSDLVQFLRDGYCSMHASQIQSVLLYLLLVRAQEGACQVAGDRMGVFSDLLFSPCTIATYVRYAHAAGCNECQKNVVFSNTHLNNRYWQLHSLLHEQLRTLEEYRIGKVYSHSGTPVRMQEISPDAALLLRTLLYLYVKEAYLRDVASVDPVFAEAHVLSLLRSVRTQLHSSIC